MRLKLERFRTQLKPDKQLIGFMFLLDDNENIIYKCFTLELPYLDNKNNISSIKAGCYNVVKRYSKKYGNHFHITNVDGREYILIHQGNYYTQTEGCVLVGSDLADVNKDGITDVISSVNTMKKLNQLLPKEFTIEII